MTPETAAIFILAAFAAALFGRHALSSRRTIWRHVRRARWREASS